MGRQPTTSSLVHFLQRADVLAFKASRELDEGRAKAQGKARRERQVTTQNDAGDNNADDREASRTLPLRSLPLYLHGRPQNPSPRGALLALDSHPTGRGRIRDSNAKLRIIAESSLSEVDWQSLIAAIDVPAPAQAARLWPTPALWVEPSRLPFRAGNPV